LKKWNEENGAQQEEAAEAARGDESSEAAEAGPEPADAAGQKALLEEKEKERQDLIDRLQRTMAEFDNFRKRTLKEKMAIYDDGARDAYERLLPVFDNLERALEAPEGKDGSLRKGIEMTLKQLGDALKSAGVEAIPSLGEVFDPNVHHAVAHVEDESAGESVVVEVLQKGYRHQGKVIRPSMVKVAN
jgi:molecular chaperone GrpE